MKVCFTGSRPHKLKWGYREDSAECAAFQLKLKHKIEDLIARGCDYFITGMAQGVDMYCAEAVQRMKETRTGLFLECALPCRDQSAGWTQKSKRRYEEILRRCDKVTYLGDVYTPGCMMRRNIYMVDHCDIVLACYGGGTGGTRNTIDYAVRQGKLIEMLNTEA